MDIFKVGSSLQPENFGLSTASSKLAPDFREAVPMEKYAMCQFWENHGKSTFRKDFGDKKIRNLKKNPPDNLARVPGNKIANLG